MDIETFRDQKSVTINIKEHSIESVIELLEVNGHSNYKIIHEDGWSRYLVITDSGIKSLKSTIVRKESNSDDDDNDDDDEQSDYEEDDVIIAKKVGNCLNDSKAAMRALNALNNDANEQSHDDCTNHAPYSAFANVF